MSGERAEAALHRFEVVMGRRLDQAEIAAVKRTMAYQWADVADALEESLRPAIALQKRVLLRLVHVVERVEEWRGR